MIDLFDSAFTLGGYSILDLGTWFSMKRFQTILALVLYYNTQASIITATPFGDVLAVTRQCH